MLSFQATREELVLLYKKEEGEESKFRLNNQRKPACKMKKPPRLMNHNFISIVGILIVIGILKVAPTTTSQQEVLPDHHANSRLNDNADDLYSGGQGPESNSSSSQVLHINTKQEVAKVISGEGGRTMIVAKGVSIL